MIGACVRSGWVWWVAPSSCGAELPRQSSRAYTSPWPPPPYCVAARPVLGAGEAVARRSRAEWQLDTTHKIHRRAQLSKPLSLSLLEISLHFKEGRTLSCLPRTPGPRSRVPGRRYPRAVQLALARKGRGCRFRARRHVNTAETGQGVLLRETLFQRGSRPHTSVKRTHLASSASISITLSSPLRPPPPPPPRRRSRALRAHLRRLERWSG